MAVLDQAHLQLKMVYKEKKAIEEKLEISDDNNRYNKVRINHDVVLFDYIWVEPSQRYDKEFRV